MRRAILLAVVCQSLIISAPTTRTVCSSGCDYPATATGLQNAVNEAAAANPTAGNEWHIIVESGITYTSAVGLQLPTRTGTGYIYIDSDQLSSLPGGVRVSPAQASLMPRIESSAGPAIFTAAAANHYAFRGIEMAIPAGNHRPDILRIGRTDCEGSSNCDYLLENIPHHIIVDRSYIHGNPYEDGPTRCVNSHGNHLIYTNNYISECKSNSGDAQAIFGANTSGPQIIINNTLEGAGENFIYGGGNPYVEGLVPQWIVFRGNDFPKPFYWRMKAVGADPTGTCLSDGATPGEQWFNTTTLRSWDCQSNTWTDLGITEWPVANSYWGAGYRWQRYSPIDKNNGEFKNCIRCIVEGSTFRRGWPNQYGGQGGNLLLFNLVDRGGFGGADNFNSTIANTIIRYNRFRQSYITFTDGSLDVPGRATITNPGPYTIVTGVNDKMKLTVSGCGGCPVTCEFALPAQTNTPWYDPVSGTGLRNDVRTGIYNACNAGYNGILSTLSAFAGYTGDPFNFTNRYLSGASNLIVETVANSAYSTLGITPGTYLGVLPTQNSGGYYLTTENNNVHDNVFDEIERKYDRAGESSGTANGNPLGYVDGKYTHNTMIGKLQNLVFGMYHAGTFTMAVKAENAMIRPVFSGNIFSHGGDGIQNATSAYGGSSGSPAIDFGAVNEVFANNVWINTANLSTATWDSKYSAAFRAVNSLTAVQGGVSSPTTAEDYDIDAAVEFVDFAARDYRLDPSSPYKATMPDGRDPGADVDVVEAMTAQSVAGGINPYFSLHIDGVIATSTGGTLYYTTPDLNTCRVTVDTEATFTTPPFQQSDSSPTSQSRSMTLTGLSAATTYFVRLDQCAGASAYKAPLYTFLTRP